MDYFFLVCRATAIAAAFAAGGLIYRLILRLSKEWKLVIVILAGSVVKAMILFASLLVNWKGLLRNGKTVAAIYAFFVWRNPQITLLQHLSLILAILLLFASALAYVDYSAIRRPRGEAELAKVDSQILYLRPFNLDDSQIMRLGAFHLEQVMAWTVSAVGRLVAIGRPEEPAAPPGALRVYSDDSDWHDRFTRLARSARGVVILIDESDGLAWELEQILSFAKPKTVLVVLGNPILSIKGARKGLDETKLRVRATQTLNSALARTGRPEMKFDHYAVFVTFTETWRPVIIHGYSGLYRLPGVFVRTHAHVLRIRLLPWLLSMRPDLSRIGIVAAYLVSLLGHFTAFFLAIPLLAMAVLGAALLIEDVRRLSGNLSTWLN